MRKAILLGGLVGGALDLADPIVFYYVRNGVPPIRIPQSVAAGLLGRAAATAGGWKTAALGVLLHFCIATTWAAVYVIASRRLPVLVRRPVVCGGIFGFGVWLCMNFVVLPLSAAGRPAYAADIVLVNSVLAIVVLIGQPIAFFAARANAQSGHESRSPSPQEKP